MRLIPLAGLLALSTVFSVAGPALAAPASLRIVEGWVRATPPGAPSAAAYLTIENAGRRADRLLAVATPDAALAEIHSMDMAGGVMRMRAVTDGAAVPAGGRLALQPGGGLHIMLVAPRRRLAGGDHVTVELTFRAAGRRTATLPVLSQPPARHDMPAP